MALEWLDLNRYQTGKFYNNASIELMADWLLNDSWHQAQFTEEYNVDWLLGFNPHWRAFNVSNSLAANYKGNEIEIHVSALLDPMVYKATVLAADYLTDIMGITFKVKSPGIIAGTSADIELAPLTAIMTTRYAQELWDSELEALTLGFTAALVTLFPAAAPFLVSGTLFTALDYLGADDAIAEVLDYIGLPSDVSNLLAATLVGDFETWLYPVLSGVASIWNSDNSSAFHLPGTASDINFIEAIESFLTNPFNNIYYPDGYGNEYRDSAYFHDMAAIFYGEGRLDSIPDALSEKGKEIYAIETILHEITHVLGLGHLGDYNGSIDNKISTQAELDALLAKEADGEISSPSANVFSNDSTNYSIMSYVHEGKNPNLTGANKFVGNDPVTLMGADIFALDLLYGLNPNYEIGDTTWGYNSNVATEYLQELVTEFESVGEVPTFSIYDNGGHDTIDLSGSTNTARLNMMPGSFSNLFGGQNNVYIYDTSDIEDAIGTPQSDTIFDNTLPNVITAGDGNDTITFSSGHDTIYGGTGDDRITALNSSDAFGAHIETGAGNDLVIGDDGDHYIENFAGFDTVEVAGFDTIETGSGNDTIKSAGSLDFLTLGGDNLVEMTSHDATSIKVRASGAGQKDTFTIATNNGIQLDYVEPTPPTPPDTTTPPPPTTMTATEIDPDTGATTSRTTTIELIGVNTLNTTDEGDKIAWYIPYQGSIGPIFSTQDDLVVENINTRAGNDTIAIGGNDTVFADFDDLVIDAGSGDDTITFEGGASTLIGGHGSDTIITRDRGEFHGHGLDGRNQITDTDKIVFKYTTVTSPSGVVEIDAENDTYKNSLGETFTLTGFTQFDVSSIHFTSQLFFNGSLRSETITGSYRDDTINANVGNDYIEGKKGNDYFLDGQGEDTIYGGLGDDTVDGVVGEDSLYGDDGIDWLYVYSNENTPIPGSAEKFRGAYVQLDATGGKGLNLAVSGYVGDFKGVVTATGYATAENFENVLIRGDRDDPSVASANDVIIGNQLNNYFDSTEGDDTQFGDVGDDTMIGGDGHDTLEGHYGNDSYVGGAGYDYASFANQRAVQVDLSIQGAQNTIDDDFDTFVSIENLWGSEEADQLYGDSGANVIVGMDGDDTLWGKSGNDLIVGGLGDDVLRYSEGADTLNGGAGFDYIDVFLPGPADIDLRQSSFAERTDGLRLISVEGIYGTTQNDTLNGDDLDNGFHGGDGDDSIWGHEGNDYLRGGEASETGSDILYGGIGEDTIYGGGGDDMLWGEIGKDSLYGEGGLDIIYGGADDDFADGGDGDDFFVETNGSGDDTYYGNDGIDMVNYSAVESAIVADLANDKVTGDATGTDIVKAIEILVGTAHNDKLLSGAGTHELLGGNGDDTLHGGGGSDTLYGDDGADTFILDDTDQNARIIGGEGTDILDARAQTTGTVIDLMMHQIIANDEQSEIYEVENVIGGVGKDNITGDYHDNHLDGYEGNDTLDGGYGNDTLVGGRGDDVIVLQKEENAFDTVVFSNGDGDDTITGIDWMQLLATPDTFGHRLDLYGFLDPSGNAVSVEDVELGMSDAGDLVIKFYEGSSLTLQGKENTFAAAIEYYGLNPGELSSLTSLYEILDMVGLPLWQGDGFVDGTSGADFIDGDYEQDPEGDLIDNSDFIVASNNDVIKAGAGDDTIVTLLGNDTIRASLGNDWADLGKGDDHIIENNGSGNDTYDGGDGYDTLSYASLSSAITVALAGAGDGRVTSTQDGTDYEDIVSNIEAVIGTAFDDVMAGADSTSDYLDAGAGNNELLGGGGNDTLIAGDGTDLVRTNVGNDVITTNEGDDTIRFDSHVGFKTIDAGSGTDLLELGYIDYAAEVDLTQETLQIKVFDSKIKGFENINAGAFSDLLIGDDQNNIINAGDGHDTINSGAGNDTIYADAGDDIVNAGDGNDVIIAGSGEGDDTYIGGEGTDITVYTSATAGLVVNLATGLARQRTDIDAGIGVDRLKGIENVIAGSFDDVIIGDDQNNFVLAGDGDDTIMGGKGHDRLQGGTGDDVIAGGLGSDTIDGGDGTDTVVIDAKLAEVTFSRDYGGDIYVTANGETDVLSYVSRLQFTDVAFDTDLIKLGSNNVSLSYDDIGLKPDTPYEGTVSVVGSALQGKILLADVSTLSDPDGIVAESVTYQWYADDIAISGATQAELDLTQALVGKHIHVQVQFVDNLGYGATVESAPTAAIVDVNDIPSGVPQIQGDAEIGAELTANIDGLSDPDGDIGAVTYRWLRDGGPIPGANQATYMVTEADERSKLSVEIFYRDAAGFANTAKSASTNVIIDDTSDVVTNLMGGKLNLISSKTFTPSTDLATNFEVAQTFVTKDLSASLNSSITSVQVDLSTTDTTQQFADKVADYSTKLKKNVDITHVDLAKASVQTGGKKSIVLIGDDSDLSVRTVMISNAGEYLLTMNDVRFATISGDATIVGGAGANTVIADGGRQSILLGADDDDLHAGGGDDTVGSQGGDDTINGGTGNDRAFGGAGNDSVDGGDDDDTVLDSWGADTLLGGSGADTLIGFEGGDTIDGGAGSDVIYGGRHGDNILGGADNDVIYGDTVLFASRGADTIEGGAGDDLIQGGFGADTFVFNANTDGNDTIARIVAGAAAAADFESGVDQVRLIGFGYTDAAEVMDKISTIGGNAVFDDQSVSITFTGVTKADLSADDFIFV